MQAKTKVLSVGRALQGEVTALSQVEKPMENLCHAEFFFTFFPLYFLTNLQCSAVLLKSWDRIFNLLSSILLS